MKRPQTDVEKLIDMLMTIDLQIAKYSIKDFPEEARESLLAGLRRARTRYDKILGQYAMAIAEESIAKGNNNGSSVPSL